MDLRADEHARQEILAGGWVQHLAWFPEVDSTNSQARRWLKSQDGDHLPALFIADSQSAGRGRGDHQWWSPSGCLMMTLVIDGQMLPPHPTEWSQLALVCGVAVAETIAGWIKDVPVHLKWPNDVYLDHRKCGGILIESESHRATGSSSPIWMIGIGLNVAVDWSSAPTELTTRATCVSRHASGPVSVSSTLVELIGRLQTQLEGWTSGRLPWLEKWREYCLLSGRVVRAVSPDGSETIGLCEGVDVSGKLILRHECGVELLNSAEIVGWQ